MNEKHQLYIMIGVFALVLGGEGVYGYFSYEKRAEMQGQLSQLQKEEKAARTKLSTVDGLREEARKMAAIIEEYVNILPSDEEARSDSFLVDIDNFARNSGLEVLSGVAETPKKARNNSKKKKQQKNFVQHRYRFQLRGTFLNFLRFTNRVENHARFLRVDKIDIKPLGADEKDGGQEELVFAEDPRKDIQVVISTYTYSKGGEDK